MGKTFKRVKPIRKTCTMIIKSKKQKNKKKNRKKLKGHNLSILDIDEF